MTLKEQWLAQCWKFAGLEADFYSGCRKILRPKRVVFIGLDDSLVMADAGYTKSKTTMLTKNYLHEESKAVAIELWKKRCGQAKYGSVGFTCYNHFVKGGSIDAKRSKRASVFGPCIQSVTITWVKKGHVTVDVFYRTTEFFKKFPADLVFIRDVLLAGFDLDLPNVELTCHFANVTMHPMYAITALALEEDPVKVMRRLAERDKFFSDWTIKWSARYICDEYHRGIAKFSQALRVQKDALERIDRKRLDELRKYFRDNHPGYRGDYSDPDEDQDD